MKLQPKCRIRKQDFHMIQIQVGDDDDGTELVRYRFEVLLKRTGGGVYKNSSRTR